MIRPEDKIEGFVAWLQKHEAPMRHESASFVADQVGNEVMRVNERLGVEVADAREGEPREVIITAFSEPQLFPLVRKLVDRLAAFRAWKFVALKPPRGFAVRLAIGRDGVDAKELRFASIPEIAHGLRLVAPANMQEVLPTGEDAEELAWLVVETGIGEELAAQIQHIEFSDHEVEGAAPIETLADYVSDNWTN